MKRSTLLLVLPLNSACAVREANVRMLDDQRPTTLSERTSILAHIKATSSTPIRYGTRRFHTQRRR